MSEERPRIAPESPGGINAWMGYLAGKLESVEARQNRQNGSVDDLVKIVGQLPCNSHSGRLAALELFERTCSERAYTEARDHKRDISSFAIKLGIAAITVVLTTAASVYIIG